jgi:hypothetical protein
MLRFVLAVLTLLAAAPPAFAQKPTPTGMSVERGDLRVPLSDGRVLRGADLVGAHLRFGEARLRIAAVQPDPMDKAGEVWLFDVRLPDDTPMCEPAPDGSRLAMPIPDTSAPGGIAMTCTSGAAGKCIRFGYAPWRTAPDGQTSLAPYHAACVNMIRGAYGGPEKAWTKNGMQIDVYDHLGVQTPDNAPDQAFEAGWTPDGAVCVAHPRVPENGSLVDIAAASPRLAGLTGPGRCTEAVAKENGALVFNRSRP